MTKINGENGVTATARSRSERYPEELDGRVLELRVFEHIESKIASARHEDPCHALETLSALEEELQSFLKIAEPRVQRIASEFLSEVKRLRAECEARIRQRRQRCDLRTARQETPMARLWSRDAMFAYFLQAGVGKWREGNIDRAAQWFVKAAELLEEKGEAMSPRECYDAGRAHALAGFMLALRGVESAARDERRRAEAFLRPLGNDRRIGDQATILLNLLTETAERSPAIEVIEQFL